MTGDPIKKPELLAPAGSFDSLRAAINAGADAVYMGGSRFGARAYADNPDEVGILKAIEFCHLRDRKIYLTVNTLLKEKELEGELFNFLKPVYEAGVDAVIVQDIGVMEFIGKNFPGLDIHVSTQASLTMAEGIRGITGLLSYPESVTRVVPARELSIDELKKMRANTCLELEVFVHGALCCCYSGQCLLSSLAGGRSGNRGRCAQPCRRLYSTEIDGESYKGYYLSPKDMCTLDVLGNLIDTGIDSFKIEGRMKSPEYAAGVVSVYRDYIDRYTAEKRKPDKEESASGKQILSEIYNRGGFNEGYLNAHNGKEMMSTLRPGHNGVKVGEVVKAEGRKAYIKALTELNKGDVLEIRDIEKVKAVYEFTVGEHIESGVIFSILTMKDRLAAKGCEVYRTKNEFLLSDIRTKFIEKDVKVPVNIFIRAKRNEAFSMEFSCSSGNITARAEGQTVQNAINSEISADYLKSQAGKLGNTDFYANEISIEADTGIFVPVGEIKKVRRDCAEALRKRIIVKAHRNPVLGVQNTIQEIHDTEINYREIDTTGPSFTASVRNMEQLKALVEADKAGLIKDIYIEMSVSLPETLDMIKASGRNAYIKLPRILRDAYFEKTKTFCNSIKDKAGLIASNYEAVELLKEIGARYRTDHNIYCFNNQAKERLGVEYTLPVELNEQELKLVADANGEMIIYGLLPVMISAQCAYKTVTGKCNPHDDVVLTDEKGYFFKAYSECGYCYNIIYNSAVECLLHRFESVKNVGCGRLRLDFTFENATETSLVVRSLSRVSEGHSCELPTELCGLPLTNGHFNRGIE